MENIYKQISDERYEILMTRYRKFQETLDATEFEPVKVFDPLPKRLIDELELIRAVSKDLQKKKDEDLSKAAAAQATQQAEADAKKKEDAKKAKEDAEKEAEKEDA